MAEIDSIIEKLAATTIDDSEPEKLVSFAGKGLKLDTEEDAENIVKEIQNCSLMTTLCLEGNTIGVPAAKAIGKALEFQPNFKKALWMDMFTQRTENEIPDALRNLSSGVILTNAHLTVLDLSDNAFGPRGLEGVTDLLRSPSCYTLHELHLNNNGLGISGAEMLASALSDCLINSQNCGTPFQLRVFVCGRNRLENEGCAAVFAVLKDIGTLEFISIPQNGIYYEGIQVVSKNLTMNTNLKYLNLQDNCLTLEGSKAIAECLPELKNIKILNFADCLITSEGAKIIAKTLQENCPQLKELDLGYNEIDLESGLDIIQAVVNKESLEKVILNGNQFGTKGCVLIEKLMEELGKTDYLGSLSEDEGDDDEDNLEDNKDDQEDNDNQIEKTDKSKSDFRANVLVDFVSDPTLEKLIKLHKLKINVIEEYPHEINLNECFDLFVMVSSIVDLENADLKETTCYFVDNVLSFAFTHFPSLEMWEINSKFATCLGLVKSEDGKIRSSDELDRIFMLLSHVVTQSYFSKSTLLLLKSLLSQPKWFANFEAQALLKSIKNNI